MKRILTGLWRSSEQTQEKAQDEALRTRYFKLGKDKAWEEALVALRQLKGYRVVHEVKSVGEIIIEKKTVLGRTQDITVTLISMNPIKTAIDIYSASRGGFGDLGSNYRVVKQLGETIDHRLREHKITS